MDSCDVLIVGGGPAGSTCARLLTRAGMDVLVLDKSEFPRDKVCAGWVTPQVVEELEIDLADYARVRTLQPISGFSTGLGQVEPHAVQYGSTVSYAIRRCEFDHYLLERSAARLRLGEAWRAMRREGSHWIVNDAIRTKLVVGAGGHFCPVARQLGAQLGKDEAAIYAQEIEFEMSAQQAAHCRVSPEQPELYFCDDLKGYGWCVRKHNFLNIGLGREGNHRLNEQVQGLWSWLVRAGKIPAGLPGRFKGHAYLLYSHAARPLVADAVLIIGDAAGLAYAQSGEGIRPAIESGIMAAQVIKAARGDYSAARLAPYEAQLKTRFGERGTGASARWVPERWRVALARVLMRQPWFTQRVVIQRWFLHADEPALRA
jgi:menaquinone-9 beta-reductase